MLTGKQKSYLKGLAHTMQPIIQVGKKRCERCVNQNGL